MPTHPTRNTDSIRRINVACSPENLEDIDLVITREGVTLTEAVRRLMSYGAFLYRASKVDRDLILREDEAGNQREVIIL